MGTIRTLDPHASFREFTEFYLSCEHSVSVRLFNKVSRKPFSVFYDEFRNKEITLSQHPELGIALRCAKTSRGIIRNRAEKKFIVEVSRTYPNGDTVPNYPNYPDGVTLEMWSISETIRRGDTAFDTLLRGMTEEMDVKPDKITPLEVTKPGYMLPRFTPPPHKSSVYEGVWTEVETIWHTVETHKLSSNFKFSDTRDNGVLLNREWLDDL